MKRRIRRIANFFAFNLLFFALYLNFIHQDKSGSGIPDQRVRSTAAVTGTVPVSEPEKYLAPKQTSSQEIAPGDATEAANLSVN
ncbi:MAG TPA: hypothetical protein VIZ28_12005 [Chitinophagaceae bacterium]